MTPLSRRHFLLAATATGTTAILGTGMLAACTPADERSQDEPDPWEAAEGLVAIGAAYLATAEAEADRAAVAAALGVTAGTPREPGPRLAARAGEVRDDFASGDVVEVDGWVLARTEAQICALAAFDHRASRD